jgi:hypothetical protein
MTAITAIAATAIMMMFVTKSDGTKAERDRCDQPYGRQNSKFPQPVHLLKNFPCLSDLDSGPMVALQ